MPFPIPFSGSITTSPPTNPPINLNYNNGYQDFTYGVVISTMTPTFNGGTPTLYIRLSGTIPPGLIFNSTTGIFTGTPTEYINSPYTWTMRASNLDGFVDYLFDAMNVFNAVPAGIAYTNSSQSFTVGVPITRMTPSNTGGVITSWTIPSGSIITGISIDGGGGFGSIAGTPTTAGTFTWTMRGTNSVGYAEYNFVSYTVNPSAPTSLTYSNISQTFTKGIAITNMNPSNSGGTVVSYDVHSGSIVLGLSLNTSTGEISGTPISLATYTWVIRASNVSGTTDCTFTSIQVVDVPPVITGYTNTGQLFYVGSVITGMMPITTGGTVITYTLTGSLPVGLSLSSTTGLISGTPTTAGSISFSVVANNTGGSSSFPITIVPFIFDPSFVSGLQFWFDAQDATTTNNGSAMTAFKNKANAVSGTINGTFTYNTSLASLSQKSYTMATSAKLYSAITPPWGNTTGTSYYVSMMVCYCPVTINGGFNRWYSATAATSSLTSGDLFLQISPNTTTTVDIYKSDFAAVRRTFSNTKPFIVIGRQSTLNAFVQQRIISHNDGAGVTDTGWLASVVYYYTLSNTLQNIFIGTPETNSSQNITFSEAILYNTNISDATVTLLINYLVSKYGFN